MLQPLSATAGVPKGGAGSDDTVVPAESPASDGARHRLTDEDITRFLRARKGDVPATVDMLRAALKWREASGANYVRSCRSVGVGVVVTVPCPCSSWTNRFLMVTSSMHASPFRTCRPLCCPRSLARQFCIVLCGTRVLSGAWGCLGDLPPRSLDCDGAGTTSTTGRATPSSLSGRVRLTCPRSSRCWTPTS